MANSARTPQLPQLPPPRLAESRHENPLPRGINNQQHEHLGLRDLPPPWAQVHSCQQRWEPLFIVIFVALGAASAQTLACNRVLPVSRWSLHQAADRVRRCLGRRERPFDCANNCTVCFRKDSTWTCTLASYFSSPPITLRQESECRRKAWFTPPMPPTHLRHPMRQLLQLQGSAGCAAFAVCACAQRAGACLISSSDLRL